MVIFRSRSDASVRVAMMAGTEQPNPISIGTKLRPERPMRRSGLSITNATRANASVHGPMSGTSYRVTDLENDVEYF